MKYYIGWDVGAWKCTKANNSSCDALVLLDEAGVVSRHRDNMSGDLQAVLDCSGDSAKALIDRWFGVCGVNKVYSQDDDYIIAIDTPLGWPKAFALLLQGALCPNWAYEKAASNFQNTLLFRRTERELGAGFSAIVDSIGSQSTKGMAMLCALGAKLESWGVWKAQNITLIETYPKACLRSDTFVDWMCSLPLHRDIRTRKDTGKTKEPVLVEQDDTFDAAVCACLAKAFVEAKTMLKPPPAEDIDELEKKEGWIFHPVGKLITAVRANRYKPVVNAEDVPTLHEALARFRLHIDRDLSNAPEASGDEEGSA